MRLVSCFFIIILLAVAPQFRMQRKYVFADNSAGFETGAMPETDWLYTEYAFAL